MGPKYIHEFSTPSGRRVGLTAHVVSTMRASAVLYPVNFAKEFARTGVIADIPKEFNDFLGEKFDLISEKDLPPQPDGYLPCRVGKSKFNISIVAAGGVVGKNIDYAISAVDKLQIQQWLNSYVSKHAGQSPSKGPHSPPSVSGQHPGRNNSGPSTPNSGSSKRSRLGDPVESGTNLGGGDPRNIDEPEQDADDDIVW